MSNKRTKGLAHRAHAKFVAAHGDELSGEIAASMLLGKHGMKVTHGHHRAESDRKVIVRHASARSVNTNRPGDCNE